MDARALREDARADDRSVGGNADARIALDRAADAVDLRFVDPRRAAQAVVQHGHRARQRRVAGPLAQPVHGDVNAVETRTHGGGGVGHGEVVVVVGVEIEMQRRITLHQVAAETFGVVGVEDAQRIGAHEPADGSVGQSVEHRVDVVGRTAHAVGPILKVEVHLHPAVDGRKYLGAHILQMPFGRAAQLPLAMFPRTFGQQVDHAASGGPEPVERHPAVDESQRFHTVGIALGGSPFGDGAHGLLFALRDPRRGDLDAAYVQFLQQQPGDGEFFTGVEGDARGLLAVAQRGVHDFNRGNIGAGYLRAASKASIRSAILRR